VRVVNVTKKNLVPGALIRTKDSHWSSDVAVGFVISSPDHDQIRSRVHVIQVWKGTMKITKWDENWIYECAEMISHAS